MVEGEGDRELAGRVAAPWMNVWTHLSLEPRVQIASLVPAMPSLRPDLLCAGLVVN